jgi:prevent-host-death family protein
MPAEPQLVGEGGVVLHLDSRIISLILSIAACLGWSSGVPSYAVLMELTMKTWLGQEAEARFSEFLDASLVEGPQMVTCQGVELAVLVSVQEWRRLQQTAWPSLKDLLLVDEARAELVLPGRGAAGRRPVSG